MKKNQISNFKSQKGFTLIEMIVSVALFAVVMVVSVGALLSLTAANKKAQAIQSVMNNLNITLDSMVRNIRMGNQFDCVGGNATGQYTADCVNGTSQFTFTCNPATAVCGSSGNRWTYSLCGTSICKNGSPITSPDITVSNITFYVVGTASGASDTNNFQPKVVIVVQGNAGGSNIRTQTTFHIQATAVQRELDL